MKISKIDVVYNNIKYSRKSDNFTRINQNIDNSSLKESYIPSFYGKNFVNI